jgi:hypothetical protein
MDKSDFALLFHEAVRRALQQVELALRGVEPVVVFHGKPNPPSPIKVDEALDLLWLSPDRFYRVIDVSAFAREDELPLLFVRPSGHKPVAYSETWDPSDLGPFNAIGPATPAIR